MKILTVKFGQKYHSNLVNRFLEYGDVYCYTDNKKDLSQDVNVLDPIKIHNSINPLFYKLHLFSSQMPREEWIYFDLDVVIYGDVTKLFRRDFTVCFSYWRDKKEMTKYTRTMLNSGVMSWYNNPEEIYNYFINNEDEVKRFWPGIDPYIENLCFDYNVYEPDIIGMRNKWTKKPIIELSPRGFVQPSNVF